MDTLTTIQQLREWRRSGELGFVPTMGALHEGHASLIRQSVAANERTVVSIFVNPAQFGPKEDLARYPRTLDADLALCSAAGADAVFAPDKGLIYPPGFATWVTVEGLSDKLCGASRPGHFRGVTTVVAKLFNMVQPARAYFGQKDAQQVLVLRRMARDLDLPIELVSCPIVRETDGLAMSSRNRYLNEDERARAVGLSRALADVDKLFAAGTTNVAILRARLITTLDEHVDKLDYAEILDAEDLAEITEIARPALAAVAAFVGGTRLIDNTTLVPAG